MHNLTRSMKQTCEFCGEPIASNDSRFVRVTVVCEQCQLDPELMEIAEERWIENEMEAA